MLVYDRRKTHVSIISGKYGIIKANTVCNTGEIIEYFTNLTGIIDNSVPFLKNDFTAAKISLVRNDRFSRFPERLLLRPPSHLSRKYTDFDCLLIAVVKFLCFLYVSHLLFPSISVIQHIFRMNSTSETAVHVRKRRFFKSFLLYRGVFINHIGK